jgi:DNA topoisomerase-1
VPSDGKHKRLVIVESPAKAKTIAGYLGDEFIVESSVGHIRDLPERAADIPAEYKKEKWARLGVNVEDDFRPLYVVDPDKKKKVSELKKLLKDADELLLATDEDREGEAIAWHLFEVLSPKVPVKRMVLHEITKDAIDRALEETRDIDERLVVERERERMAFRAAKWWDIGATFDPESFEARLVTVDGRRVALGRDFGPDGQLRNPEAFQLNEEEPRGLASRLVESSITV